MTAFTLDSLPKRLTSTTYQVAIITDIYAANLLLSNPSDWDDHMNLAICLCTQDKFQLRYVAADILGGNGAPGRALDELYDAYEADLVGGTLPVSSLTRRQLQSITVLGPNTVAPAAGFYTTSDPDYALVHNASQRLIKCARDIGDPAGTFTANPYGKLWVSINGAYNVFAQTLHEAIVGAQLPDILSRCVFFGSPFWNGYYSNNAFTYWANNCYQVNSSTPGIFGATQMISPFPSYIALMDNVDASQQAAWTTMKTQGAMGAYLDATRAVAVQTAPVPRAGESAFMYYWLLEAERLGSWDPTNTSNGAGKGQVLYNNNNWPYLHGGAGYWSGSMFPTSETEFSPSHWGTRSAVDTLAEIVAEFDMTGYRTWLTTNFARYA